MYVDGFVLPVPKKNLKAYFRISKKAGKIWREHGALECRECAGEDLKVKGLLPFPRLAKAKTDETVVFSRIAYRSRAHRDRMNAMVMKDPRINGLCDEKSMPFDMKREAYGGFKLVVEA